MKDGVYEVANGQLKPATQALVETNNRAAFQILGDRQVSNIIPIEQACIGCTFWKDKFASTTDCQNRQRKDALARGFTKVICPKQFA